MRITKITEEELGIEILVNGDYDYFIPKYRYNEVIQNNISSWINQIMFKTWADIDSLYRIGAILSKQCSRSDIDWVKTFELVEWHFDIKLSENPNVIKVKLDQYGFKH
jgi:hypothetical protein